MRSFAIGDLSDIDARKALIHTFVREIVLYNDKIMITYNFSDRFDVCEITKDRIEEIEKQSVKTAFSFTVSSYKQNASAPSKRPRYLPRSFACPQTRDTRTLIISASVDRVRQSAAGGCFRGQQE